MAVNKSFRTSKLDSHHTSTLALVNNTPQTLHTIAAARGISDDQCERELSVLIDEGLVAVTKGNRTSIKYTLA